MFVTASSFNFFEILPLIHHTAGLAPATYLFTAIAFPCKRVLYVKFRLQGVAQIFGAEPFSAEKVVAAPWLPDCSRDCERSCEPRARPLCRRPAGVKLCPETNTAEPRHASEWENESNITKGSLCSSWDFYGVQLYPGCARPDLRCCLLSKRQWWSLIQRSFTTRFLALNCVDTRQSPTHRCPKPSRLKTQPRQPRKKIMFWFLSHKNKHSFQVKPLSNRVLYSWSCSVPAAPTALLGMEQWGTHLAPRSTDISCFNQFCERGTDHMQDSWFPLKESRNTTKTGLQLNFWRAVFTFGNFLIQKGNPFNSSWNLIILFALQFHQ